MLKNINFKFNDMPFCLEYIGDNLEELDLQDEKAKHGSSFDYDCNFFRLHYLGEKGKIALSYGEILSKEIYYDSEGNFIDSGKDAITIFDYYYDGNLIKHINDLVNEKILNNEFNAKINVVFPSGGFIDKQSQHICCPLYYRWKNHAGKFVSASVLPHLIVNEKHIPDSKYKGFAGLRKVTILDGNETIGNNAFADCDCWLRDIELSKNLREIGDGAFYNTGLDVAKLPKTVKRIGKNAFLKTSLKVLAVYCDIDEIEPQDLLCYASGRLSDGDFCEQKIIIILYDLNNIKQYTLDYPHWSDWNEDPTKVYRQIDSETGDRFYTRESSSWRRYKNSKKYDSLDEESWHTELSDINKAQKIAKMFETDRNQSEDAKGWIYSEIIFVPEHELDRAVSFIKLKQLKDKLNDYQEKIKQVQKLQQEATKEISVIEPILPDFDDFNVSKENGYYLVMNKKYDSK